MDNASSCLQCQCLLMIKRLSYHIEVHRVLKESFGMIPSKKVDDLKNPFLEIKKIATDFYNQTYEDIQVLPERLKVVYDLFHHDKEFVEKELEKDCCKVIYDFKKAICDLYCDAPRDPEVLSKNIAQATEMEKIVTILQEFIKTNFNVVFDHGWISLDAPNGLKDLKNGKLYFRDWRKKILKDK